MIKVNSITPVRGRKTSLQKIRKEFLRRIKLYHNPFNALCNEIAKPGYTPAQRNQLQYLIDHFDDLITAPPSKLRTHIDQIDNGLIGLVVNNPPFGSRFELTPFGITLYEIFGYEKYFRTTKMKGLWLAKQVNIKACPYRNGQYTLYIDRSDGSGRAKFQFDHFFSKKRFPYLSISLYNLIPSCASCNLNKGEKQLALDTHYHPYHTSLADVAEFVAKVPVKLEMLTTGKVKELDVPIIFRAKFSNYTALVDGHNDLFDIVSSYSRHVDIIHDLLYKAIVNNSAFKKDLMNIRGLFNGDDELYYRYLIGNYSLKSQILERPLAKFTQDVARQFELIPPI